MCNSECPSSTIINYYAARASDTRKPKWLKWHSIISFAEILHRFYNRRQAERTLHAKQAEQFQVQSLANCSFDAVRVLYHDADRLQYFTAHDEGPYHSLQHTANLTYQFSHKLTQYRTNTHPHTILRLTLLIIPVSIYL